ncbi:LOW QUALITY PROTEIN: hypothetical protein BCV70DRAFT_212174 [Testicularia cyperi]|uniref:Bromo domain-containing protein n=1 Tax=Testicularia cyperi TaxID=1882483 RepID=A0A317XPQ1_9BASI|nr:LOW QUALITY PROTEIN: hypothetical protein BCV70DRAFT_212174 [Testicularia cyperi]
MSSPYQQQQPLQSQPFASGSDSPMMTPVPIKRGRGRPPKNRNPNMVLTPQQPRQQPQPQHQPSPQPRPAPPPRHSQITSPRLRAPQQISYQPSSANSPFAPPPSQSGFGQHPSASDQSMVYQPLPGVFVRPSFATSSPSISYPTAAAYASGTGIPSFPPMPSFQRQQELQQQQNHATQQPTSSTSNGIATTHADDLDTSAMAPSLSSSTGGDAPIMTAAGGSIGAVGNAGASPASRTRRKADMSDPDLKLPDAHDLGWMNEPQNAAAYATVVDYIRNYTDSTGRRLALPLDECPDPELDPDYYVNVEKPTSLAAIQQRIQQSEYARAMDFEMDMLQLFENGRRLFPVGSPTYGDVIRLYHALTKSRPSSRKGITAESQADASRNFSSIPFGPGAGSDGDLTTRISSKAKTYYEHLNHKGKAFRVGDWVHLIFKDPDQGWTHHAPSKKFFKDEVVKTGYFADHHIEDILEKVMFIRGRPKPEYWDPKSPLYVTESRYNEQQRIKSWASCVPEEIRKAIAPPPKEDSPFLRGIQGPGALADEDPSTEIPDLFQNAPDDMQRLRKRSRAEESVSASAFAGASGGSGGPVRSAAETFTHLATQVALRVTPEQYQRLQMLLSSPQAASLDVGRLSAELGGLDVNLLSELRNAAIAAGVSQGSGVGPSNATGADSSSLPDTIRILDLVGAQKGEGTWSELPSSTLDLFADQPGGDRVSWYPAMPLNGPLQQQLHKGGNEASGSFHPAQTHLRHHSVDFLQFQSARARASPAAQDPEAPKASSSLDASLQAQPPAPGHGHSQSWGNGSSTPRGMLFGQSPYIHHTPNMYDYLTPSARSSPLLRSGLQLGSGGASSSGAASGFPATSSNGSADEALTPVMSQNIGWQGGEWGDDPQKTAEALAEFTSQYGNGSDGNNLNFSHFLS